WTPWATRRHAICGGCRTAVRASRASRPTSGTAPRGPGSGTSRSGGADAVSEGDELLKGVARGLSTLPDGVAADVRAARGRFVTMRFARSMIHQPHLETESSLSVRVAEDRRIGIATGSRLDSEGFLRTLRSARALA